MKRSDLLVKLLWQDVDLAVLELVVIAVIPKFDLGKNLVGERAAHHETGVTSGAAEVKKAARREQDDTVTVWEFKAINLVLDVHLLDAGVVLETLSINFVVEVTDVANDGIVLHLGHVLYHDDIFVAGGSHKDVCCLDYGAEALHFETLHARLERADGIAFGDYDARAICLHGLGTSLADISVSADYDLFACKHDISGAHETIG